jgi:hypothetical protein
MRPWPLPGARHRALGWGKFGGDLLVGDNKSGLNGLTEINAYNLTTGVPVHRA